MDFVQSLLNLLASMATIGALFFLTPLYTFLKAFCYIYTSIYKEDVAGKVVLIVGASSGIGEVAVSFYNLAEGCCFILQPC
ncbi:putative 11-beta-hydroxysteroid dehydrogenase [Helianthus annuus]|nr:putative 11-beta-hydroxysteroid dehydrogenase [Helianthus annuus]KAJ0713194.1 putative 11-beta-hydroxysteroid dehydrogenase [Helianthus annuus]